MEETNGQSSNSSGNQRQIIRENKKPEELRIGGIEG